MSVRLSAADKKRAELEMFVAPSLRSGEDVVTGIGVAAGPLHPLTPLIPVFGWIAMFTPRYRTWGLVVTTERVFLVERSRFHPGHPCGIALEAPVADVAVMQFTKGVSSGLLLLKIGEQTLRLYVVAPSMDDVPAVQSALTGDHAKAPDARSMDLPPPASPLVAIRETDRLPEPAVTPPTSAAVQVSPIFVALFLAFVSLGAWLWAARNLNRIAIFAFVVCGWIVSLCLHEFGHAYAAYRGGDHSVAARGYLTLDPRRYSHPVTSIAMPLVFLVLGGIGLPGGAVYIDRTVLRTRGRASLVAAAGPLTNLVLAFVLFAPFHFMGPVLAHHPHFQHACAALAVLELVAAFLNLLPIPPLDGFGIVEPLFTGPGEPRRRPHPAVIPLLFFVLVMPNGPGVMLWHSAYRVGYAMGVPHGVAGDGLRLARFWTEAPPPRDLFGRSRTQASSLPMVSNPVPAYSVPTTPETLPAYIVHTTQEPVFPNLEVTPGVNNATSENYLPLFGIRGTGSRTTPPLRLPTKHIIGGVESNGRVKVSIVPAGPGAGGRSFDYYTNDAGSGGASAELPRPGMYVVRVEAIDPNVRWMVDLDDEATMT